VWAESQADHEDHVQEHEPETTAQIVVVPERLPNGVTLQPQYRMLLNYFTEHVLASLSCHPSIHEDLCKGLVPTTLHSPQLLSACLALSAAGFVSRGITEVGGVDIVQVLAHLQSSGLSLLRIALASGQMSETLMVTCLIWCLADVFVYKHGASSWQVHLQGIKALLGSDLAHRQLFMSRQQDRSATRHLYLLYLSLQTLPHMPSRTVDEYEIMVPPASQRVLNLSPASNAKIDGFLGYNEELLLVLQQVERLSGDSAQEQCTFEAHALLAKVKDMIRRDAEAPPDVSIGSNLSPKYGREFSLCHRTFQQATLIHVYRRLYRMPSGSRPIQDAVAAIEQMVQDMDQGKPCHAWVAMAMPLFTLGCEAFTDDQRSFVMDKICKLETCLGSLHVRTVREALEDIWKARTDKGDCAGDICASELLGEFFPLR
jgi:hypothetical protein